MLQFLTEMQFQSKKFVSFYEREIGIEKIFSYCFENRYHVGEKNIEYFLGKNVLKVLKVTFADPTWLLWSIISLKTSP